MGNDEKTTEILIPTSNIVRVDFAQAKKTRDEIEFLTRAPLAHQIDLNQHQRAVTRWLMRFLAIAAIALLSLLVL